MSKYTGRIDIIDYHNNCITVWHNLHSLTVADVSAMEAKAAQLSKLLDWPIISQDEGRIVIEHPEAHKIR